MFFRRKKDRIDPKEAERLFQEQLKEMPLEKGDLPAMIIAGLITFLPAVLIIAGMILFVYWIFS